MPEELTHERSEPIHVVVAMNFTDAIMEHLREVSPRLRIERHFPKVPDSAWANAEVLYTLNTFPDLAQAPRLRWIQLHTAGMENAVREPIIQAEDVEVTSTSGIHAVPVAEWCMAMMLALTYKLPQMLEDQAKTHWPDNPHKIYAPRELDGQTIGIAGYGALGRELARQASSLGMKVLATKRNLLNPVDEDSYLPPGKGDTKCEIPERLYPPEALASMARECDFLALTVPLTALTRHMVNETIFEAMKDTAVLINVARGGVVDEKALVSALAAKKIGGAALDVFEEEPLPSTSPLWNMDNVIISPHTAGHSLRYHEKAAALFAENLRRYLEKRPLYNRLDRVRGY